MQLAILRVTMQQYEQYHYDKEMLRKLANKLGQIEIESQCDLEHVRNMLNAKFEESISYPKVSQDWCFIDCKWPQLCMPPLPCLPLLRNIRSLHFAACTAEHYFRIDRAQEHLHYICDIAIDELYILDHEAATMPQTPDQERSFAAFSQRQAQNERRQLDQAQGHNNGNTGRLLLSRCWQRAAAQTPPPPTPPEVALQQRLNLYQQQAAEQLPYIDRRMFCHLYYRKKRIEL